MNIPNLKTRKLTTGVLIAVAVIASGLLYLRHIRNPWTRDGQVTANIIMVAPRITGIVVKLGVTDNQFVKKDDLLFEIDPIDYEINVESAHAQLEEARDQVAALEAAVVSAKAGVMTAEAQIVSAGAQVTAAEANVSAAEAGVTSAKASIDKSTAALDEAVLQNNRAQKLAIEGAGSVSSAESKAAAVKKSQATLEGAHAGQLEAEAALDQAKAALDQTRAGSAIAEAQLASAKAGLAQAQANLGETGDHNAQVRTAKVNLASAELDLERTKVLAPTDGYATNLSVDLGDYASPGTPMLAFVDSNSFHVQGFFRETQLRHMKIGDRAEVTLMSHRNKPVEGVVESIGWAINPPNIATTEGTNGLVPQVQPSFDWIRLAQRVPVRVKIEKVPEGVQLISGTTASVLIKSEE